MSWSKTPPTKDGLYGWRQSSTQKIHFVRVFTRDGHLRAGIPGVRTPDMEVEKAGKWGEWFSEPVVVPWEKQE